MSITLMSEVWPLNMKSTDKIVLLALADAASDRGGSDLDPCQIESSS